MSDSKVLSRWTYKVFFISGQITLIGGDGALVDGALPCASQIDTGILQDKCNPGVREIHNQKKKILN